MDTNNDAFLQESYISFCEARKCISFHEDPIPFHWLIGPDEFDLLQVRGMNRFLWFQFAEQHIRDLTNAINSLLVNARNLESWGRVISDMESEKGYKLLHEFYGDTLVVSLGLPYTIKSRFYFVIAHLSHQANSIAYPDQWSESVLPEDSKINEEVASRLSSNWPDFKKFKRSLDSCNSKKFRDFSRNFRNKYAHRYGSILGVPTAAPTERNIDNESGEAKYIWGGSTHSRLEDVSLALAHEFRLFREAYGEFQCFVMSQRNLIIET